MNQGLTSHPSIINFSQEALPEESGDGSLDDAVVPDALLEILEEMCVDDDFSKFSDQDQDGSSTASKRKSPDFGLDNVVIKLPLAGEIVCKGRQIFCSGSRCGSISYLTHWDPPAMADNCSVHSNCYVTCPLVTGDEDAIIKWVGSAFCFRNAEDHGKSTPKGSYHRRNPPKK